MGTATTTHLITRAHTATHLTNAIAGAIADILGHLDIDTTRILTRWPHDYDPAIQAWINEGSLTAVIVECHRPDRSTHPVFEFPISYHTDGSANLNHRHVALARQWTKLNRVPTGTTVDIICTYRGPHSPQPGWGPTHRASTDGLRARTLGTLAAGPYAEASIRCYTK